MAVDYTMNDKKQGKLDKVKAFFDGKDLFYEEKANGHLVFDRTKNLWATTEKWHDSATGKTGVGINDFYKYLTTIQ